MTAHSSGLVVRQADLSRAEPPRWAWQQRIVLGYLNLLLGNEGVGKGTLVAWLVARITRGELPGDLHGKCVTVGILGDEDSFDGVWTPRLHAAGADLSRVRQLERPDGGFVNLREDRDKLHSAVSTERIGVLFFDQLLDNLGVGVDDWRNKAVRDALQPLRAIARALDVAAIGCLHPNKRADSFRQLVAGAPAFNAVSRSSLLLAEHPDDTDRRVLVRGKGNLAATPRAVEFELASYQFEANGHTFDVPCAVDFATSHLTADDLIVQPTEMPVAGAPRTSARELIAEALADGDWHLAAPILAACEQEGIVKRAAERAAKDLGVEKQRTSDFPAKSQWRHPHTSSAETVGTVATVESGVQELALNGSNDRYDTYDSLPTRDTPVATGSGLTLADAEVIASDHSGGTA
jgi:AAA domain